MVASQSGQPVPNCTPCSRFSVRAVLKPSPQLSEALPSLRLHGQVVATSSAVFCLLAGLPTISVFRIANVYLKEIMFRIAHVYLKVSMFRISHVYLKVSMFRIAHVYLTVSVFGIAKAYLKVSMYRIAHGY